VVTAPSHCTVCGADIHWYDNLPIISYLVLRGRCRNCHTPYSCRYLVVEALTGTLFTAVLFKVGLAQQVPAVLPLYWWCILLAVSSAWIDAKFRIIPDALTYPALLVGLVLHGVLPSACGASNWYTGVIFALLSALLPAGFLSIFSIAGRKLTGKDVLGWGDVKFIAACGALLGFPGALFVLLSGSLSGTVLPRKFVRMVDRFGDDPVAMKQAGIAYATEQIIDIYSNGINAVHVYSMNKPDVAEKIQSNLKGII
jgi:leader peptidase (prepilin peptidase)/N-methyltransferase